MSKYCLCYHQFCKFRQVYKLNFFHLKTENRGNSTKLNGFLGSYVKNTAWCRGEAVFNVITLLKIIIDDRDFMKGQTKDQDSQV